MSEELKTEPPADLVDAIAATIRRVDGNYTMGAGVLAGHIARAVLALFQPQMEAVEGLLRAAESADEFITNGIGLGFIRMPDRDVPDPAHKTPDIIRNAIKGARAAGLGVRHE